MTKKIICALAVPLALAGCSGRSGAEKAVREALKDPDSAKFGAFYYNSTTQKGCIEVNAKNSMGGYTGDKQVHLIKDKEGWSYLTEQEETPADCRSNYADLGKAGDGGFVNLPDMKDDAK